jgi:peptide/nickel transport system substrate-binding protein
VTYLYRFVLVLALSLGAIAGDTQTELRFSLRSEPRTLDPLLVDDDSSEVIRYLTAGVLVRIDRGTQQPSAELAREWKIRADGRIVEFRLRPGVVFSDGTPFTAQDVAFTLASVTAPQMHSPLADAFKAAGPVTVEVKAPDLAIIKFSSPFAGMLRRFDELPILSSQSTSKDKAVLGPYVMAEYKQGAHILLRRNARYWKRDTAGKVLPYIDAVRIGFQPNRELDLVSYSRGDVDLLHGLDPLAFERLNPAQRAGLTDLGASFDSEFVWFNQSGHSPIAKNKLEWFRSTEFRKAISEAINREDLCRVAYRGHAKPASGPFPSSNAFWYNTALKSQRFDPSNAAARLKRAGFHLRNGVLFDHGEQPVKFSLITNSGNRTRERIAAMVKEDLGRLGIQVTIVTLDFNSLLERISRTFDYDACLLGLVNIEPDPMGQMNVWLSSSSNHQWNPRQTTPETVWEAEIDKLMLHQARTADDKIRKRDFDRVQQIIADQLPFIYLVHPNALVGISPSLKNLQPTAMRPQLLWNIEYLAREPLKGSR